MKCASCNEEKPETEFSKSQLKKGNEAKCMSCSAQAANEAAKSAGAPSGGKTEKACAACGRTGVQFSKAQAQKKDGKCVECVQASTEAANPNLKSSSDTPKAASTSPRPVAPPSASTEPKPKPTATSKPKGPEDDDEDEDSIRVCCDSCKVFKPLTSFEANAKVCKVCADARRRGETQTTMKDHGLVASDGTSHRKLSWIPDGLKNYLAFMEVEGREGGEEEYHQEEEEEEDPDMEGGEYYYQ